MLDSSSYKTRKNAGLVWQKGKAIVIFRRGREVIYTVGLLVCFQCLLTVSLGIGGCVFVSDASQGSDFWPQAVTPYAAQGILLPLPTLLIFLSPLNLPSRTLPNFSRELDVTAGVWSCKWSPCVVLGSPLFSSCSACQATWAGSFVLTCEMELLSSSFMRTFPFELQPFESFLGTSTVLRSDGHAQNLLTWLEGWYLDHYICLTCFYSY